jgi:prevent-host-death family protein
MSKTSELSSVGVFDAKTHLSALLDRVERGETIIITRHGKEVARLSPPAAESDEVTVRKPGRFKGRFPIDERFFEPLPDDLLPPHADER